MYMYLNGMEYSFLNCTKKLCNFFQKCHMHFPIDKCHLIHEWLVYVDLDTQPEDIAFKIL